MFKSSHIMAQLNLEMDASFSNKGLCNKTYVTSLAHTAELGGFITLTLWIWNLMVRKIQCLATIRVKCESTRNISVFWKLLYEVFNKCKGDKICLVPKTSWPKRMGTILLLLKRFLAQMVWQRQWIVRCTLKDMNDGLLRSICHWTRGKIPKLTKELCDAGTMEQHNVVTGKTDCIGHNWPASKTWNAW